MKTTEELKESFKELSVTNTEAGVILEATMIQEEDLRRGFWQGAAARDQTGKKGECSKDKLWIGSQRKDTQCKTS